MINKIDRTGEINYNTFGSKMVIVGYRTNKDLDVYFPEYNWTAKNAKYNHFKKGQLSCPYEKRTFGIGYLGEGKYKVSENGKKTKCYITWQSMLERCYDSKFHEKRPTYKNCEVYNKWLCFQNFAEWYYENYYEIKGERMCLDKDILNKRNEIYSPDNCMFVPERINTLFVKCNKVRGDYPIGVTYHKQARKFMAQCSVYDFEENKSELKKLGFYDTPTEAFRVYKEFKEQNIKNMAEYYKGSIPDELYNALYKYEVEIDD